VSELSRKLIIDLGRGLTAPRNVDSTVYKLFGYEVGEGGCALKVK